MNELQRKIKRLELEMYLDEITLAQNYSQARNHLEPSQVICCTVIGSIIFGALIFNKNNFISGLAKQAYQGVHYLSHF
jgi:hypothetical protein